MYTLNSKPTALTVDKTESIKAGAQPRLLSEDLFPG